MISRITFCSAQPATMRAARFGPMPVTSRSRCGLGLDQVEHRRAEGRHQLLRHRPGRCRVIMPEPRYFSMPSSVVGGVALRKAALNCSPWVRSLIQVAAQLDPLAGGDGGRMRRPR